MSKKNVEQFYILWKKSLYSKTLLKVPVADWASEMLGMCSLGVWSSESNFGAVFFYCVFIFLIGQNLTWARMTARVTKLSNGQSHVRVHVEIFSNTL